MQINFAIPPIFHFRRWLGEFFSLFQSYKISITLSINLLRNYWAFPDSLLSTVVQMIIKLIFCMSWARPVSLQGTYIWLIVVVANNQRRNYFFKTFILFSTLSYPTIKELSDKYLTILLLFAFTVSQENEPRTHILEYSPPIALSISEQRPGS